MNDLIKADKNKEGWMYDVWQLSEDQMAGSQESKLVNEISLSKIPQAQQFDNGYTSIRLDIHTSKKAFTLAEVLITLGVIGVVAAMTLGTLINNYQKYVTLNKLKSTYSLLNNALNMAKPEYGADVNQWDMPTGKNTSEISKAFAQKYLTPNLKIVDEYADKSNSNYYVIHLANGVVIKLLIRYPNATVADSRVQIYIYINGLKKKYNSYREIFVVELGGGDGGSGYNKNKFLPYGYIKNRNKNTYKSLCKNDSPSYCFALIMYENWQISKDYPW